MLKKRNIAMAMAVATVATSVAPAFAAVTSESVTESTLISKVTELLNTRYSDAKDNGYERQDKNVEAYENSVYKIYVNGSQITSVKDLKSKIEAAKVGEYTLKVDVVDKGHKTVNGKIVATEDNKYDKYADDTALKAAITDAKTALTNVFDDVEETKIAATTTGTVYDVTLKSGEEFQLTADSYELDFNTGLDKNGNEIDLRDEANLTATVGKNVVAFKIKEQDGVTVARERDLPEIYVSRFVLPSNTVETELKLNDYTTEFGYNKAGEELSKVLIGATILEADQANGEEFDGIKVTKDGKEYRLHGLAKVTDVTDVPQITKVKYVDGRYEFTISLQVSKKVGTANAESTSALKLTMTSTTQPELEKFRTDIINALESEIALGEDDTYTTLAGEDRFETAIEVSKATFNDDNKGLENADAVVLVGESAIVDGLAAAPLAKSEKAPILLAKKDSLTADTVKEIKRVFSDVNLNNTNTKTIYIVGGENVISEAVEKQILSEMNVKIVRLAGEDRVETSLKIARKLNNTGADGAYIVGADGEADAMSIASIASVQNKPVIVTAANTVSKDTLTTLALEGITNVEVIGGEAKVSTDVMKDLKLAGITATRIAGDTRQETNAKVIEEKSDLFKGNIFVAKDGYVGGNDKLIDALAVAPLAAYAEAPIVLTTEELTKEQSTVVDEIANDGALVKVGNGISSKVIKSLVKLMGLK